MICRGVKGKILRKTHDKSRNYFCTDDDDEMIMFDWRKLRWNHLALVLGLHELARWRQPEQSRARHEQAGHDAGHDGPTRATEGQVHRAATCQHCVATTCGLSGGTLCLEWGLTKRRWGWSTQVLRLAFFSLQLFHQSHRCEAALCYPGRGQLRVSQPLARSGSFRLSPLWVVNSPTILIRSLRWMARLTQIAGIRNQEHLLLTLITRLLTICKQSCSSNLLAAAVVCH